MEKDRLKQIRIAKRNYNLAIENTRRVLQNASDLPLGHPDGSSVRLAVMRNENEALRSYYRAVEAYLGLVLQNHRPAALTPPARQRTTEKLTAREFEVLSLIATGLSTRQIADRLGITFKTAATHRARLMEKLDIHQVAGLVRYAIAQGLIEP